MEKSKLRSIATCIKSHSSKIKNLLCGTIRQCNRFFLSRWVILIPNFNPSDHSICKLVEVLINRSKFCLNLPWQFNVAFLSSCAVLWKRNRLEKWDQFFLPVNSFVLFLEVDKWVACFAVPDVRQTCFHSQSQMVTYHLHHQYKGLQSTQSQTQYITWELQATHYVMLLYFKAFSFLGRNSSESYLFMWDSSGTA